MAYVNKKRPYKKEYEQQKNRKEQPLRNARERARRKIDKLGIDRKGKDVDHIKALSKGGTNDRKNLRVVSKNKTDPSNEKKIGQLHNANHR